MRVAQFAGFAGLFSAALLLGGCGQSSPGGGSKAADIRGVIASASDCASFGADAVKACASAIERAVSSHEATSASYNNLDGCEKAVGEGKCERAASGKYRSRLSAFMVTVSGGAARAEPLYPVNSGVGFRSASNSEYLASDDSVTFSRLALSVAETQAGSGKKSAKKPKMF